MLLMFASFTAWGLVRPRLKKGDAFWYALDAALIFLLEYQSKFLVNYFFHILYFSAIVEAGISLERKRGNIAAAILSAAALLKFIYALVGFGAGASILSQFIFSLFALAFLITLINFGKLQQEEREKSRRLYRELIEAYQRLEELSAQKEKAAVLEERNRIAGEMHDSLGHRLTSLIMQMEIGKEYLQREPEKTGQYLDRCAASAREALTDTRKALRALGGLESRGISRASGKNNYNNGIDGVVPGTENNVAADNKGRDAAGGNPEATESITDMIEAFSNNTGIKINCKLPGEGLAPQENIVLYRVIQECITNAARHGKATRIEVEAGRDAGFIWFRIADNGLGGNFTEGFGLGSMRRRLEEMGGNLEIDSGQGFSLTGRFKTVKQRGFDGRKNK